MATPIRLNNAALMSIVQTSPKYHAYAYSVAELIIQVAIQVFKARQVQHNEGRTSETTPPKYIESFEVRQIDGKTAAVNTDPAWHWVEWGAHAGGRTPVLRYKPMTHSLEIVANREAM